MDAYLQTVRSPGGQTSKEFLDNLSKYSDILSRQNWSVLDGALTQINESTYTLGLLGLFAAKSKSSDLATNFDAFVIQISTFLDTADEVMLRLAPTILADMCQIIADYLGKRKLSIKGIGLVSKAIRKLQIQPKQLTSIHCILLEMCLASSCLRSALPFLTEDIDDFSSELKGSDCKGLLLYLYYGGLVYTALKKFREAIYFLEACIRVPALTLSHIMLESYKKYILLSLIHYGDLSQAPKCSAQVINRVLKPTASQYSDLATAFMSHNPAELTSVLNRHQESFRRDGNFGLVKQVKSAQTKINIQRLTKTFLTLSLADVASRVQLTGAQQAEKYILSMIQDGEIYTKINQKDGMVVFLDNKEKYDSLAMMQKVEGQIGRCMELNRKLAEMNERLATNPDYVSKIVLSNDDEGISSSSKIQAFNM